VLPKICSSNELFAFRLWAELTKKETNLPNKFPVAPQDPTSKQQDKCLPNKKKKKHKNSLMTEKISIQVKKQKPKKKKKALKGQKKACS
jgi:hypothetical protein